MDRVSETPSEPEPAVQAWMELLASSEPEPSSITPMSTEIDVSDRVAPPPLPKMDEEEKDASPLDTGELAAARPPKLAPTLLVAGAAALVVGAIAIVFSGRATPRAVPMPMEAANASVAAVVEPRPEVTPPPAIATEAAPEPPPAATTAPSLPPPAAAPAKETAPAPIAAAPRPSAAKTATKPAPVKPPTKAKPAPAPAPKKGKPADTKKK